MKKIALLGDGATHPGQIITTRATKTTAEGKLIAVEESLFECQEDDHGTTPITSSAKYTFVEGGKVILDGDEAECGARIIASTTKTFAEG